MKKLLLATAICGAVWYMLPSHQTIPATTASAAQNDADHHGGAAPINMALTDNEHVPPARDTTHLWAYSSDLGYCSEDESSPAEAYKYFARQWMKASSETGELKPATYRMVDKDHSIEFQWRSWPPPGKLLTVEWYKTRAACEGDHNLDVTPRKE